MTTGQQAGRSGPRTQRELPPPEEREWEAVEWEVSPGGVLAITLNRPESLNALSFQMIREIVALLIEVAPRPEVRVVTLRGAGSRAFCSGDDLKGMGREPGIDNEHTGHHQLIPTMRALPKPIIALLVGTTLGAGFELALACDLRVASDTLDIGDHRVQRSIGLIAGSSWFAQRLVGFGRASELLLTGRHLTAAEALGWGLISARFPVDEFEEGAAAYVQSVAELPTACVGIHKAALEYSAYHGLRDSLTHETLVSAGTRGTEDADEGRSSFFERRKPTYSGR